MAPIDIALLEDMVEANKSYRRFQLATYYGSYPEAIAVDECTSMERLILISAATGAPVEVGMRNEDGSARTKVVNWHGCRFWAPFVEVEGANNG